MEAIAMQSAPVPFKVTNLFAGYAEGAGIAKATPLELTLEFTVKETILSLVKSGVKELRIPRSEIASINLKPGLFRDKIVVRVKSLSLLQKLPGCDSCELTLRVARRDRDQAGDLVLLLGGTPLR